MGNKSSPVPGYCDGCHMIKTLDLEGLHPYIKDISWCLAYANPRVKTAADRGGHIGCAMSPKVREKKAEQHRARVGQQKGRRGKKKR